MQRVFSEDFQQKANRNNWERVYDGQKYRWKDSSKNVTQATPQGLDRAQKARNQEGHE